MLLNGLRGKLANFSRLQLNVFSQPSLSSTSSSSSLLFSKYPAKTIIKGRAKFSSFLQPHQVAVCLPLITTYDEKKKTKNLNTYLPYSMSSIPLDVSPLSAGVQLDPHTRLNSYKFGVQDWSLDDQRKRMKFWLGRRKRTANLKRIR